MNGDVEAEAPRPRPLSAGIWTLFSWLRRTDRSSSSESVSSVGSDRTVASFDFLAPLNYKNVNTPLVLPSGPLTETYKKRLHERNLRRQHDRDLTLRRKYGLYREEGLGYDAFSLPSARRLQKDTVLRQDRERRATSESTRRSAYVPGKRRAPLPPIGVVSATLPRTYKRKRPAPKPPVKLSEENKENVEINKTIQMNSTADVDKHSSISKNITLENKNGKHSKHEIKEVKLRTDKSFLKQIFDNKKRNSAIDTSRIKLLPSISELDKQAAEIIEANKALRASEHNDSSGSRSSSTEETWICTTCLRKYKPVVTCCIYCVIKESSNKIKNSKNVPTYASNTCTQTDDSSLNSSRKSGNEDKKKLREMLKEMKDSLPKRPKHYDKYPSEDRGGITKITETPTLRIGSTNDEKIISNLKNTDTHDKEHEPEDRKNNAKHTFLMYQPSSSKDYPVKVVTSKEANVNRKSAFESIPNLNTSDTEKSYEKPLPSKVFVKPLKEPFDNSNFFMTNKDNKVINTCPNTNNHQFNSTNSEKELTKSNENVFVKNNHPSILQNKKCDSSGSGIKNKIECLQLGNVLSSNVANVGQAEGGINSVNSRNINLHTPLKISSLLNPLYTPRYKTSNNNISDSSRDTDKILPTKVTNVEDLIKEENQKTILPNNTVSTTFIDINVQAPSKSYTKLFHETLQKTDASITETLEAKKSENTTAILEYEPKIKILPSTKVSTTFIDINVQAPNKTHSNTDFQKTEASSTKIPEAKKNESVSSEVKALHTPGVKNLDFYDRRRNLINQLEQAISKGDEQLAAEAAAKLAKLKLACSVLSFSSQIVAEPIFNKTEPLQNNVTNQEKEAKCHKVLNSASNEKVDAREPDKAVNEKVQQEYQKLSSAICKETNKLPEASTSSQILDDQVPIEVWVEDKEAARGPIPLRISRKANMGELKLHVETSLGLEIRLQRWIVGRTLCTDDNTPLGALAGHDLNAPFYLCLVESETNKDTSPHIKADTYAQIKVESNQINNPASGDVYTELMKLEQQALVPNTEDFECGVCIEQCVAGAGVVLRECIHTFCRDCLTDVIRHCEEPVVPCPAIQCPGALQEREIRAILSAEEYERWLARGLAAAESGTRNTFHCRTRDCKGWAFCEPGVRRFPCPVCKHTNCVPCQAVHKGETCEQYQVKLRETVSAAESNQTDEGTQALLKSLISRGEALECPECSAIITKKWGCDWVKCSACKTEICWVTKGRRWGPGGKGDTSGGCRCGVEGKRCHPSCGYCH